jgi:hypothetical protein
MHLSTKNLRKEGAGQVSVTLRRPAFQYEMMGGKTQGIHRFAIDTHDE